MASPMLTPLTGGEWGHASKEIQDLQAGKLRRPNALKKTAPQTLYVPGTFIPGEISPGVKVPRTPPAPHLWALLVSGSLDDLRIILPGFWTPGYGPRYVSAVLCCNSAGKERDSHPRIIFPASLFTRVPDPRLVRNDVLCFAMFHADVSGS